MSVHALTQEANRAAAEKARRQVTHARLAVNDSSGKHPRHTPRLAGILAALAQGGIWLTAEQRVAVDRLLLVHPEQNTRVFTPEAAVAWLAAHGIRFTDEQLSRVTDDGSVSGIRRLESDFEDSGARSTRSHPAVVLAPAPAFGWPAWLLRLAAAVRGWFTPSGDAGPRRAPRGPDCFVREARPALGHARSR